MPSEPLWLEPADVTQLNRRIVAATGEPFALLDAGLLEGAVNRPRGRWYYNGEEDALALAVTLLFAIAGNHPFEQGNKRTAFEAAVVFLLNNGYRLDAPDSPGLAILITDVIAHRVTEKVFEEKLRPHLVALPGPN